MIYFSYVYSMYVTYSPAFDNKDRDCLIDFELQL